MCGAVPSTGKMTATQEVATTETIGGRIPEYRFVENDAKEPAVVIENSSTSLIYESDLGVSGVKW